MHTHSITIPGYHGIQPTLLTVMYRGGLVAAMMRQMVSCKETVSPMGEGWGDLDTLLYMLWRSFGCA